jgi:hypothetical protein
MRLVVPEHVGPLPGQLFQVSLDRGGGRGGGRPPDELDEGLAQGVGHPPLELLSPLELLPDVPLCEVEDAREELLLPPEVGERALLLARPARPDEDGLAEAGGEVELELGRRDVLLGDDPAIAVAVDAEVDVAGLNLADDPLLRRARLREGLLGTDALGQRDGLDRAADGFALGPHVLLGAADENP